MKKLLIFILCLSFMIMPSMIKAEEINEITPYGTIIPVDKVVSKRSYYNRGTYSIQIVGRYQKSTINGSPHTIDLKAKPVNGIGSISFEGYYIEGSRIRCEITLDLAGGDYVHYTVFV